MLARQDETGWVGVCGLTPDPQDQLQPCRGSVTALPDDWDSPRDVVETFIAVQARAAAQAELGASFRPDLDRAVASANTALEPTYGVGEPPPVFALTPLKE